MNTRSKNFKRLGIALGCLLLATGGLLAYRFGLPYLKSLIEKPGHNPEDSDKSLQIELAKDREAPEHTVVIPEDVRVTLGIRKGEKDVVVLAKKPTGSRPLVLHGSTMLDPAHLHRIRASIRACQGNKRQQTKSLLRDGLRRARTQNGR